MQTRMPQRCERNTCNVLFTAALVPSRCTNTDQHETCNEMETLERAFARQGGTRAPTLITTAAQPCAQTCMGKRANVSGTSLDSADTPPLDLIETKTCWDTPGR